MSTGTYTLSAFKSNDQTATNGVTVTDVALVQRHILGTALLGAGYKVVSADVNNDQSVTVADVAALQSFIVGNSGSFGGALWRFYSVAAGTVNSPWPLTATRTYASLATATAQDFTACKLGDVNDSWNAAIPRAAPDIGALTVAVGDAQAAIGQRVRLPLTVSGAPCGGLQLTLSWPAAALRFVGIVNARPGLVTGTADATAGTLPLLWTDPAGGALPATSTTLLEAEFELIDPAGAPALVAIGHSRTPVLGVDAALAPLPLTLVGGTVRATAPLALTASPETATFSLWPNPAHATVQLCGAPRAAVTLRDGLGRTIRTAVLDATGAATLDVRTLPAGIYSVRVGGAVRRLVVE